MCVQVISFVACIPKTIYSPECTFHVQLTTGGVGEQTWKAQIFEHCSFTYSQIVPIPIQAQLSFPFIFIFNSLLPWPLLLLMLPIWPPTITESSVFLCGWPYSRTDICHALLFHAVCARHRQQYRNVFMHYNDDSWSISQVENVVRGVRCRICWLFDWIGIHYTGKLFMWVFFVLVLISPWYWEALARDCPNRSVVLVYTCSTDMTCIVQQHQTKHPILLNE